MQRINFNRGGTISSTAREVAVEKGVSPNAFRTLITKRGKDITVTFKNRKAIYYSRVELLDFADSMIAEGVLKISQ